MEKTLLTSGILVTAVALFSFSQHEQISSAPRQMPVAAVVRAVDSNDTVPQTINNNESKYSMSTSMDGKQYRIVEVDGKVTELYIDNVRIPDNKIADYNDVIDKLHAQLKENKAKQVEAIKAQKEVMKAQADLMKENIVAMKEMQEKQAKMNADQLKEKVIEIEKQAQDSGIMKEQAIQMKVQTEVMKKAMTDQEILMKAKAEKFAALADQDKELLELQEKQAEDMKQKTEIIKEQTKKIDAIKDVQKENQIKINQDLQKQIEQLKIQNEKLNLKIDSIYKVRNITPA